MNNYYRNQNIELNPAGKLVESDRGWHSRIRCLQSAMTSNGLATVVIASGKTTLTAGWAGRRLAKLFDSVNTVTRSGLGRVNRHAVCERAGRTAVEPGPLDVIPPFTPLGRLP